MKVVTKSAIETRREANNFLGNLKRGKRATILALSGDLGSGKTTFVQGVARALGIEERVVSPTFIIERIHNIPQHPFFKKLFHIDAYRIDSEKELEQIHWSDITRNTEHLIVVEWADRIPRALPDDAVRIHFTLTVADKEREITWQ